MEIEGGGRGTYIKRMAAHQPHAHRLARQHGVLGEGGLLLRLVEALGVIEHAPRIVIVVIVRHVRISSSPRHGQIGADHKAARWCVFRISVAA